MWRLFSACLLALFVIITVACTKKSAATQVIVEIPAGFSGNFVLEMGVREAGPLPKEGDAYLLTVPRSGKVQTSTLLEDPHVKFKNSTDGQIWGYSQRVFTTGDGISVGGKIEFFVGTQKDFEAEQNKKNKSGGFLAIEPVFAGA